MPQTVPNRPTKGAVAPTEASSTWPNCRRASTVCNASRSRRVRRDSRLPAASSVAARVSAVAASSKGSSSCSVSNACSAWRPSLTPAADQKAGTARSRPRRARRSSQAFHRISAQALTDIASSSSATARPTTSLCAQKSSKPVMSVLEAQHVVHAEQAGGLAGQEARRAQAALGIDAAAAGLVADLDALAGAGEQHGVVANDVAAAHGGEADGGRVARAGDALAAVDGAGLQVTAQRIGDDLAHLQRGAAGRVDFVAVMGLDDLDVEAFVHRPCREVEQLEHDVDADAHIGREDDGGALGQPGDLGLLLGLEAGRADHRLDAQLGADGQMGQRRVGAGEVDQHIGAGEARAYVVAPVERRMQAAIGGALHGFDQHPAHAPGGAGHGDLQRRGAGHGGLRHQEPALAGAASSGG
mmetsp:Transcript_6334/g.25725  ORF Transcript_6334/g.25725 Transcript_6334/m.25725 type:complete len:413 (-) Transcript_6334:1763-3001(-)